MNLAPTRGRSPREVARLARSANPTRGKGHPYPRQHKPRPATLIPQPTRSVPTLRSAGRAAYQEARRPVVKPQPA
ncbi:MAG: hypothetical protein RIR91_1666 [Verrucomicrobiota bacterium]